MQEVLPAATAVNLYSVGDGGSGEELDMEDMDYFDPQQQQNKNFKKKNFEVIQKMQEKKLIEQRLIEEERQKMFRKQEKLKNFVLRKAAEIRE